jgi:hypothetical protein
MAKFKAAGRPKKADARKRPNAIGCIVLLALLFFLLFWMMYMTVRQG